jgi:hypothetical protein
LVVSASGLSRYVVPTSAPSRRAVSECEMSGHTPASARPAWRTAATPLTPIPATRGAACSDPGSRPLNFSASSRATRRRSSVRTPTTGSMSRGSLRSASMSPNACAGSPRCSTISAGVDRRGQRIAGRHQRGDPALSPWRAALPPPGRRAAGAGAGGDHNTGTPERPVVCPRRYHDPWSGPHAGQAGHSGRVVPVRCIG